MSRYDDEFECPHDETDGEGTCLDCGKFLSWRDVKGEKEETPQSDAAAEPPA